MATPLLLVRKLTTLHAPFQHFCAPFNTFARKSVGFFLNCACNCFNYSLERPELQKLSRSVLLKKSQPPFELFNGCIRYFEVKQLQVWGQSFQNVLFVYRSHPLFLETTRVIKAPCKSLRLATTIPSTISYASKAEAVFRFAICDLHCDGISTLKLHCVGDT